MKRQCEVLLCLQIVALIGCGQEYDSGPLGELNPSLGLPGQVSLTKVSFSPNPGALVMHKYIPKSMPAGPAPLLVALHGCMQGASQYVYEAGWHTLADKFKFYLLVPEQTTGNNPVRCFNWAGEYGDPANMVRGKGENASIAAMVARMKADLPGKIDPKRVYVTGFSSGGYMANVMLATYPDVFSAGAVMEGGPYRCADNVNPAFNCMKNGKINIGGAAVAGTDKQWGDLVRKYSGYSWSGASVPRVMIWHGTSDTIVYPPNQQSQVRQWANLHGLSSTTCAAGTLKGYATKEWTKGGKTVIKTVTVTKLRHAVAIDPGSGKDQGGSLGGYSQDVNAWGPYHSWLFLSATSPSKPKPPVPGDKVPPKVNVTSPAAGATVKGTVKVSAQASDDKGISRVEFYVDGVLAHTDTSAPYEYSWETSGYGASTPHGYNGAVIDIHAVSAVAYDVGGNKATDDDTTVFVLPSASSSTPGKDKAAPTVKISSLSPYYNYVGTLWKKNPVKVAGTAADDKAVSKVEIKLYTYKYKSCFGAATVIKTLKAAGTTTWSLSLDVSGLTTYQCYKLEAVAHDKAGKKSKPAKAYLYVMNK